MNDEEYLRKKLEEGIDKLYSSDSYEDFIESEKICKDIMERLEKALKRKENLKKLFGNER